ncbi:alpha/beta hydrolase family protein [Roseibium sediminis]|uniref:alpha/beta hydrolase family protein n=1 Tax=Roseibium sediminis TaxID=1775174 RepID=UPI00123D7866|nr:alpha/beta fold hydrolase [Roseibium sediminis]
MLSNFKFSRHLSACALALTALTSAAQAAEKFPGYDRFDIAAAHRAWPVQGAIWYPAANRSYVGVVGDNPVFEGTRVLMGPEVKAGKHPLVVLSHGSGGNMDGLGWLSSELVKAGYMVLAVNHPGSTSGDSSPRRSARLGERARDLSAALDTFLADPYFADHVDREKIVSLGFSLGGTTVLQSVGLQFDKALTEEFCDAAIEVAGCDFYRKGGVDFSKVDAALFEGNFSDSRISAAIAVDPGFTVGATAESVAAVEVPVLLITLGTKKANWKATDTGPSGSGLDTRLENGQPVLIEPANHFSFLAHCKPAGADILAEEGEDPICDEPEGGDRGQAHSKVVKAVADFLAKL